MENLPDSWNNEKNLSGHLIVPLTDHICDIYKLEKGSDKINYNDINNELSKLFTKAK